MTQLSPNVVPDVGGTFRKVDVIKDAYSKIRISGLTVNPTPEDLELALNRYENMMAEWFSGNIVVNYNFEDDPNPNSYNNVIRSYQDAMSSNLAIRLVPDFGKEIPELLFAQASSSLSNMCGNVAIDRLNQVQYPTRQPIGSGNTIKQHRWLRFYRTFNVGSNNAAQKTMFIGDIDDFSESFTAYLKFGETILTYSIIPDPALIVSNDSNTDDTVSYRIEASQPSGDNQTLGQILTIVITTSSGRKETRQILFQLTPTEKDS
jgi:hypothetical protein